MILDKTNSNVIVSSCINACYRLNTLEHIADEQGIYYKHNHCCQFGVCVHAVVL